MIKALVVLSVVALAMGAPEADAKADPYYGYYGKRSAEAEAAPAASADPYYGYYGLGHYGYAGFPYAYGAVVYGKRSAEAAPAAKPSADPYYGYYGLGHYGYAGFPYAYGGYYYGK